MHEKYKKTSIRELKMLALLEKYGGVGEKSDGKRTNPLNLPAVGRSPLPSEAGFPLVSGGLLVFLNL